MPFTGSHPAAVLPLLGTPLCASALVIGSMIPDLPYYAPLPLGSRLTHSLAGIVGVDPLLGLVVFVAWHGLLVPPALAYAPAALARRLPADLERGLRRRLRPAQLPLLYASFLVGAATHVFWTGSPTRTPGPPTHSTALA